MSTVQSPAYPDDARSPCRPYFRGNPAMRNAPTLLAVVAQFSVAVLARYAPRIVTWPDGSKHFCTFCNVFASDVMDALMGAPLPHEVDPQGNPVGYMQGRELSANATADWLATVGMTVYGWRHFEHGQDAADWATQGRPAVAVWKHTGGEGHIAVLMPTRPGDDGIFVAQAGASRFVYGLIAQGFGPALPYATYYGHD